jgi:disulfide bond formation protein DsbB
VNRNALLLAFAWLVAIAAMLGSLYYSEIRHFIPCNLCWYQRIAMYPLAFILGVAVYRGDLGIRPYAITLVATGWLISALHNLEYFHLITLSSVCGAGVSCTTPYPSWLPIPTQALIAFTLIGAALLAMREAGGGKREA